MIKSELVQRISTQNPHLYQRDVENIVNAILGEIVNALARGDRVELRGFGAFSVKHRPALTVHVALFLLLLIALIIGVLAGGIAAWLRQAKWRRAARRLDRELRAARAEADDARRRLAAAQTPPPAPAIPTIAYRRPPAA